MGTNCCQKKIVEFSDREFTNKNKKHKTHNSKNFLFSFEIKGKSVNSIKFAESYVRKYYFTKEKKRLLVELNDNSLFIVSFYIDKLMFLTSAIEIKEKYRLISANFISINESKYYCLILSCEGEVKVVLVGIFKLSSENKKNENISHSFSEVKNIDKEKKNIDVFLNSIDSNMVIKVNPSKQQRYSISNYNQYFKEFSATKISRIFEGFNLSKYKSYVNKVILSFDTGITNLGNFEVKINNNEIYLLSGDQIICYQINKTFDSFSILFTIELSKTNLNIYPLLEGCYIIRKDLDINLFSCQNLITEFNLADLLNNNSVNITKLRLNDYVYFSQSLNPSEKETILISIIIAGDSFFQYTDNQFLGIVNFPKKKQFDLSSVRERSVVRVVPSDVSNIESIVYGPYNNGPILTGHSNGSIYIWNTHNLEIISLFSTFFAKSVNLMANEPNGMSIVCNKEKAAFKFFHPFDKKKSYFFSENKERLNVLETKHFS